MLSRWVAIPFIDTLLLIVGVIALLAHPVAKTAASRPIADYVLYVVWDTGLDEDIDVFVQGPDGQTTWYRNRDIGYASIDRDDLGLHRDSGPINQEIVSLRSPPDGNYFVSIHDYNNKDDRPLGHTALELCDREGKVAWSTVVPTPEMGAELPVIELEFQGGKLVATYPGTAMIRGPVRGN